MTAGRRSLASPVPPRDLDLEGILGEAERELAHALAELAALRTTRQAKGEGLAALRRAAAARQAEGETARRRLAEIEQRVREEHEQAAVADERRATLEAELVTARTELAAAADAERAASARRETTRERATAADAARANAHELAVGASASAAAARARLDALEAHLAEEETRGIARAARRAGGRRLDEDLVIDPPLRTAAEAALAGATRAYVVAVDAVPSLAGERGSLLVAERTAETVTDEARDRRFREALDASGGGTLDVAVRRDATGAARRILARAAWLPDLAACLAIQAALPPGWIAVPRDGSAVVSDIGVSLGAVESVLERRVEATRLGQEAASLDAAVADLRAVAVRAAADAKAASDAVEAAVAEERRASGAHRASEEAERIATRQLETAIREASWHAAQAERLGAELDRAERAVAATTDATPAEDAPGAGLDDAAGDVAALSAWEERATELRARRDRLTEEVGARDATRRDAEHQRARAEASTAIAEERMARADREVAALGERERALAEERDSLRADLATSAALETTTRLALAEVHAADTADRERLAAAERDASGARERLRSVDARLRSTDHVELEARLGLEALHESVVVELGGLGELGIASLRTVTGADVAGASPSHRLGEGSSPPPDDDAISDEVAALEAALAQATPIWAAAPPTEAVPGPARLGQLRRRFHDLGAVNPYAVEEYAELRVRLETLEAQGADLRSAISRTRDLIVELDTMIADRFRTTFQALEAAFSTRFEQLFGGGFAKLSLTDPTDLGTTGIEIVARPPGKKAQALAMLSGGERALTAVALLFAMLEVRPVPFCVLDEVDAALDEANIGRFAEALRSLANQTQFIVITHNRGTIEAADALYGVTVGDDSVSRVISLRLDEAQALAGRDRAVATAAG